MAVSRATMAVALLLIGGCGEQAPATIAEAEAALAKGDPAAARIALLNRLKAAPDDRAAHILLARIQLSGGDGVGAEQSLIAAERLAPLSAVETGLEAESLLLQKRCDRVTADAAAPAVQRVAALCAIDRGERAVARRLVDEGLASTPTDAGLLTVKARLVLLDGDARGAMALTRQALASDGAAFDALMLAGAAAEAGGDPDAARNWYAKAATAAPASLAPPSAQAALAARLGDRAGLAAAAERLAGLARDGWQHRLAMLRLALIDKDVTAAQGQLNALRSLVPADGEVALLSGRVAALAGNHATAVADLGRFVAANPSHVEGRLALADAQGAAGDPAAGAATLRPLASDPRAPRPVLLAMARHSKAAGLADADQFAARAAAPAPDRLLRSLQAAETALAAKDWARATTLYRAIEAELGRPNAVILNNLGLAQQGAGQTDAAIATLRKAAALAPRNASVLDSLGWLLYSSGRDRTEGERLVRDAARLAPGNAAIQAHLAAITKR